MKTLLGSIDCTPRPRGDRVPAARRVSPLATAVIGVLGIAAIACGGAATPDSTMPADTDRTAQKHDTRMGKGGPTGEMNEMNEMAAMPPEVKKFHETLAPRWHAEHGPQRMTDTCAAIPQLRADAEAIVTSTPPTAANPADWSGNAKQLTDAVAALDATCKASDAAAFEHAFALVHNNFHGLLGVAGGFELQHGKPGSEEAEHAEHHP